MIRPDAQKTMIEKLKAMESFASPAPWVQGFHGESERGFLTGPNGQVAVDYERTDCMEEGDAAFIAAIRNLAPEIISLWEAASKMDITYIMFEGFDVTGNEEFQKALTDLNAKASEVLL